MDILEVPVIKSILSTDNANNNSDTRQAIHDYISPMVFMPDEPNIGIIAELVNSQSGCSKMTRRLLHLPV